MVSASFRFLFKFVSGGQLSASKCPTFHTRTVELNCKKTRGAGSGKEKAMEIFAQRQRTAGQGIWKNQGFEKMPEPAGFSGKRKSFPLQTILT